MSYAHTPPRRDANLITAPKLWERLGIVSRTGERWLKSPALNFPRPMVINRRRYWPLWQIEDWEAAQARRDPPPPPTPPTRKAEPPPEAAE